MSKLPNRWVIAAAAIGMQLCLGVLYAWSVFRGPLEQHYGWSKADSIAPYRWSLLCLTLAMIGAGFWQDRKGPRIVGATGGLLLSLGCFLAGWMGTTPANITLAYGVIAGMGVGFAYVTPIATCVKWFPDRRGMVVGLVVMGFGFGSLVFAPLLEGLLGKDPSQFATTIPRTFYTLAGVFLVAVPAFASMFALPPAGWRPAGWNPAASVRSGSADRTPKEMLSDWRFYQIWVIYYLGSAVGLTAIGESAPLVRELAGGSSAITGGTALGLMSLFNGTGRLTWGSLSDRFNKKTLLIMMFVIASIACGLVLPGTRDLWRVLGGLCAVGFCFGGYLAIMPALTADYYGSARIGANYGFMFTAWGLAGFTAPRWMASLLDQKKAAGEAAAGYTQMFLWLAALAVTGGIITLLLRKPQASPQR